MKFLVVFILFFLEVLSCYSQESTSIIGKWKVVAVSSSEFYHNFENDSTTISDTYEKELTENGQDIRGAIKNVKEIINMSYTNSQYIFSKQNSYKFFTNNIIIDSGKFIKENKVIKTKTIKATQNNIVKKDDKFAIIKQEKNSLTLSVQMEEEKVLFYLKRVL